MKPKTVDVRKALEQKLERLRPIAAALNRLPELKAAEAEAREEQKAWFDNPEYKNNNTGNRDRSIKLSGNVGRAVQAVRDVEGPGQDAEREIQRLELLLGAPADVERLKKEIVAVAADGATVEKRERALRAVIDAIQAQRAQLETKAATERKEAADLAVEHRLEGKPTATLKLGAAVSHEIAGLDAELAAAQRQHGEARGKLLALAERAKAVRAQLLQALSRVAEVDYMQALENIRPIVEHRAAIARVAGMSHLFDLAIPLDEIAVQAAVNELENEHGGWQPADPNAGNAPARDAIANDTAAPGAQAAA